MISLRDFKGGDVFEIDKIYQKQPWNGIPTLENVLVNRTVIKENEVVGYGVVKNFTIATMIIDPDLEKRDKASAVRQLLSVAISAGRERGLEQLYLTTPMENFADVLRNSYGFVNCPNPFLVLSLENK